MFRAAVGLGDMVFLAVIAALTLPNLQMCKLRLRKGKGLSMVAWPPRKAGLVVPREESRTPTLSLCPTQSTADLALAATWVASGSHLRSYTIKSKR